MSENKYKPEYCQMLIDHMKAGRSFSTFVAVTMASRKTMYEWIDKYPEFKEAKEVAFALSQKFFEDRLIAKGSGQEIEGINTKDIDLGAIIFPLKTRFHQDYGEKNRHEHTLITDFEFIGDDDE